MGLSICIPTFEQYGFGVKHLRELFESIEYQKGIFEVVVSDNSQDDVIEKLCKEQTFDLNYIRNNKTFGISHNTNNAIEHAKFNHIKIMYMDDLFCDNNAVNLISIALMNHNWVYSSAMTLENDILKKQIHKPRYQDGILKGYNTIGMPSMIAFNKNPIRFDTNLKTLLDCEFYWLMKKKYGDPYFIDKPLVIQRFHKKSTSIIQGDFSKQEYEYLCKKYNINYQAPKAMTRTEIINALIKKHNYKSYLEIGVMEGRNFASINCQHKVGVDPDLHSKATVYKTSDDFFKDSKDKFDIIFIDGLHHSEQVDKDIQNSLFHLNKGGTIVCHDMNPSTYAMQQVPRIQGEWTGDCWKSFVKLRQCKNIKAFVIDTDYGVGIIQPHIKQKKLMIKVMLNYYALEEKRKEYLNLISVEEFLQELNIQN